MFGLGAANPPNEEGFMVLGGRCSGRNEGMQTPAAPICHHGRNNADLFPPLPFFTLVLAIALRIQSFITEHHAAFILHLAAVTPSSDASLSAWGIHDGYSCSVAFGCISASYCVFVFLDLLLFPGVSL